MTPSDRSISCSLAQASIEPYLDQELPTGRAAEIEAHLRECEACACELALAVEVRTALQNLPQKSCPDWVSDAVLAQVGANRRVERRPRLWHSISSWLTPAWRPAVVTAALVALLVIALEVGPRKPPPATVSPEEVARAEAEVKWTLAYLGEMGLRAGFLVRDEVIESQVVEPVKRAVETLNETNSVQ